MGPIEQLGRNRYAASRLYRRYLKRSMSRAMRRLAKRLLDDAPKRPMYRGYAA